jgi:predicted small metal-binding protein
VTVKQFRCGDVVPGCGWVGQNEVDEVLWVDIADHAREAHGMHEVPPEVLDQIRDAITEVPA